MANVSNGSNDNNNSNNVQDFESRMQLMQAQLQNITNVLANLTNRTLNSSCIDTNDEPPLMLKESQSMFDSCPKYDGTNYHDWKARVDVIFKMLEKSHYLTNDIQDLTAKRLGVRLFSTFADKSSPLVSSYTTAYDIYQYMTAHETFNVNTIQKNFSALRELKFESCQNLDHFLASYESLFECLGTDFADLNVFKVHELLFKLPEKYNGIRMQIGKLKEISYDKLKEELRQLDDILNQKKSSDNIDYFNRNHCIAKISKVECSYCHKAGHTVDKCFKKFPQLRNKKFLKKSNSDDDEEDHVHQVNPKYGTRKLKSIIASMKCSKIQVQSPKKDKSWLLDSGANNHMTWESSLLINPVEHIEQIKIASGETLLSSMKGDVVLNNGFKLFNVIYCENIDTNYLSVSDLINEGFSLDFKPQFCCVKKNKCELICHRKKDRLYYYENYYSSPSRSKIYNVSRKYNMHNLRHGRLIHCDENVCNQCSKLFHLPREYNAHCNICFKNRSKSSSNHQILNNYYKPHYYSKQHQQVGCTAFPIVSGHIGD